MIYINQGANNHYSKLFEVLNSGKKQIENLELNKEFKNYDELLDDDDEDMQYEKLKVTSKENFNKYQNKLRKNQGLNKLNEKNKINLINNGKNVIMNTISDKKSLKNYFFPKYDPVLITITKNAIYNVRNELTNYKEIINKINKEFNIPEEKIEKTHRKIMSYDSSVNKSEMSKIYKNNNISTAETNFNLPEENNNSKIKNEKEKRNSFINVIKKNVENEIKKNIENEESEENKKIKELIKKNEMKIKRKRILINSLKYLSKNGISVNEFLTENPFPTKPYELKDSEEFFEAVKYNNVEMVSQALEKNERYLFQYDYMKQYAYHWAAKLGNIEVLRVLLSYNKDCNVYDNKMRTPLYLATYFGQSKCIYELLIHGANSQIGDINGKKPIDIAPSKDIKDLLFNYVDNKIYSEK